jgi:hypothetical protein
MDTTQKVKAALAAATLDTVHKDTFNNVYMSQQVQG